MLLTLLTELPSDIRTLVRVIYAQIELLSFQMSRTPRLQMRLPRKLPLYCMTHMIKIFRIHSVLSVYKHSNQGTKMSALLTHYRAVSQSNVRFESVKSLAIIELIFLFQNWVSTIASSYIEPLPRNYTDKDIFQVLTFDNINRRRATEKGQEIHLISSTFYNKNYI